MRGGYESLVWINDKSGREYVCYADDTRNKKSFEELTDDEKRSCDNVNQLIGTERW